MLGIIYSIVIRETASASVVKAKPPRPPDPPQPCCRPRPGAFCILDRPQPVRNPANQRTPPQRSRNRKKEPIGATAGGRGRVNLLSWSPETPSASSLGGFASKMTCFEDDHACCHCCCVPAAQDRVEQGCPAACMQRLASVADGVNCKALGLRVWVV